ncbi:hypothetical protein ACJW30_05G178900 [Castanea mollissima]
MDESALIQEPKRLKLNEEQDIDEDRKNLDNLPEEILRHILFLLPTIDAIRTSMLSKRTLFLNFVERVLLLHVSDIKKFTLYFLVQHDASRVNAWISAAVKHNVQELHICLSNFQEPFSLPHCLFTRVTLTNLDLTMPCILKFPPTICFSKLKILILRCVSFSDEHSTQQLFSGFPVLEELCLDDCHWMNLKVVITILGVSLKSFYYTGEFFNEYSLHKPALLVEAYINSGRQLNQTQLGSTKPNTNRMYTLLIGFSNAKEIMLTSFAVEICCRTPQLLSHMPMFNNLLDLDFIDGGSLSTDCDKVDSILDPVPPCFLSQLKCIKVDHYNGDEKELSAVKILLKNAVALDRIVISFSKNFAGDLEKRGKVCEQFLKLPRGSKNCEFVFKMSFF